MKKLTYPFAFLALFGLNIACNSDSNQQERQETSDEIGHEMDELGDESREVGNDIRRGAEDLAD